MSLINEDGPQVIIVSQVLPLLVENNNTIFTNLCSKSKALKSLNTPNRK